MKENINHPSHYNQEGRKECIVEMKEKFGNAAVKDFCMLNAYKYLYRADNKNGVDDLKKAVWYIEYIIENFPLDKDTLAQSISMLSQIKRGIADDSQ